MAVKIEMEMPKGCADCPCSDFDDIMDEIYCRVKDDIPIMPYEDFKETRHELCPLVKTD